MPNLRRLSNAWKRDGSPRRRLKISKTLVQNTLLIVSAVFMAGSIFVLGVFAFVSRDLPDPNALTERNIPETTKIYDRTGEHKLYEIFGSQNRTLVKLQKGFCTPDDSKLETDEHGIPLLSVQATITAEDRNFCKHGGFSVMGLMRAVLFGGSRGGGSTLTQQLVKNAILTNERTLTRKAKELILSIELERRYSKDDIIQIYFNEIPYGSTYYGIEAASQNYYGKHVSDLTLGQIATLAAIPKAPTTYVNNPDLLKARRDYILDGMADQKFITKDQAAEAKKEDTKLNDTVSNIDAPHFVFYVKAQLEDKYGQREVEEGGLKVITSLDWDKQQIAEEEVKKGVEARGKANNFSNAALVAIDPKTGQVLAMVGSKDYFDDTIQGQVNVATRLRQPGSSFKPIVYAKGFDLGYTPNTVLWDVKTQFSTDTGNPYAPNDYDGGERGPIRVRDALQGSLNIPAVQMVYLVGVGRALSFAEQLGYTSFGDRSRFGLSIVLGGAEVRLVEHTNAYAAFAAEGVHHDLASILKVEDAHGNVLEEWKPSDGTKVLEPNVARTITDVLSDNGARAYVFGASSPLQLGDRPVAAKTGTTNDFRDGWTMGYTPSLAAGVWAGNNDNSALKRGSDGVVVAAPIWNAFMKRALAGTPVESFVKPDLKPTGKRMLDGELAGTTVTVDKFTGKLATEFTPPSMRVEKTFAEYHTILKYVDKNDPLGPVPEHPENDPQYNAWEAGVQDWIVRQQTATGIQISNQAAPTEFDDVHIPSNFPSITIESPTSGVVLTERQIDVSVNAFAPRGARRVEFYLDGFYLGADGDLPFELHTRIPNTVTRGFHTLKAVAYDDAENSASDTIGVKIDSDATGSGFDVIDPKNGQVIEKTVPSFAVAVSIENPTDYFSVSVWAKPVGSGSPQLIAIVQDPTSPFISINWPLPDPGDWVLSASAVRKSDNQRIDTAGIVVHVTAPSSGSTTTGGTTTPNPLNPFK